MADNFVARDANNAIVSFKSKDSGAGVQVPDRVSVNTDGITRINPATSDNQATLLTRIPAALGQTTKAASLAVVAPSDDELRLAQASTTAGQKGPLIQAAVLAASPLYTTAQTSPLCMSVNGGLRVQTDGVLTGASTPTTSSSALVGSVVRTTNFGALAAGNHVALISTQVGAVIVKPFSLPALDWNYAAAAGGILNTTTAVTIKAAAGAGIRNFITSIDYMAEALTTATELAIRDGAGGAVLWRVKIPATTVLQGRSIDFLSPIVGTANVLLEVVTLTASGAGAVYFNARGYAAP